MSYKRWISLILIGLLVGCHRAEHHYNGYIESDTIYLAEPFSGILKHKYVHRGQYVKKNQLLFEIDPYPEMYEIQQAHASLEHGNQLLMDLKRPRRPPEIDAIKAQITEIEADIALASLRYKRNQVLFNKKVISPDTLDASREQLNVAVARKVQYEANLALAQMGARNNQIEAQIEANKALQATADRAQWSLKQKKIFAPSDGYIFDTFFRQGEFVNAAAPIAALVARQNIYIEFFVPLRDLHDMTLGKKITYHYLKGTEPFHAKVVYVATIAEYMPPLVYSNENFDRLVFRVKAKILGMNSVFPGEPVTVNVEATHG